MADIALTYNIRQTLLALWLRAPIWRFAAMSAGLLTLLFFLFPPQSGIKKAESIGTNDRASYQPATPESKATSDSQAKDISNGINSTTSPPAVNTQQTTSSPRTANLSLASANNETGKANTSGIDNALLGRTYSGVLHANGFSLPLPSGNWSMLANTTINTPTATGMAYMLGLIEKRHLLQALKIFAVASKDKPGNGFEVKHCATGNPNAIFVHQEGLVPYGHQACWSLNNYFTPPWQQWADKAANINQIDRAAAGDMAAKGVSYSQDYVEVTYTRAEKWGLLEVSQFLDPEHDGIKSTDVPSYSDSDWHKGNIEKYPEKIAYVNRVKESANLYWQEIATAFANADPHLPEQPDEPAPIPPPSHFAALGNVDAVPYIDQNGREQYRAFLIKPKPRAFLITDNGGTGVFIGGTDPLGRGLKGCKAHGVQCYPYAIDDNVVWTEPPSTSIPPPSHYAAIDDIKAVPYLDDKKKEQYQAFLSKPLPRAFLITRSGGFTATSGGIDPLGRSLRNCKEHGQECMPYLVDNNVVWVPPKSNN